MADRDPGGQPPTDYRGERRRMERSLAWAVVLMLVGVGGTLIALIYGSWQALSGLLCLFAGAAVFGLLWLILTLLGKWAGE